MTTLHEPTTTDLPTVVRRRLRLRGVVQGVGFRPFVHRAASESSLSGFVGNDTAGVVVEVEGGEPAVEAFCRLIRDRPPPLARVDSVVAVSVPVVGEAGFRIVPSRDRQGTRTFVPPDAAVCVDCLAEVFDPDGRRHRYPFTTCTNCGPRFTIATELPYDRRNTTMRGFTLCDACTREYEDPGDRRFHAEPLACPDCGPRLHLDGPRGRIDGTDAAIAAAQQMIGAGAVLALKGLGGYHLVCDATSDVAVSLLRERKRRPDKPLAVMVPDPDAIRRLADVDDVEMALLTSVVQPIVLVRARPGGSLASSVAPGSPDIGIFLPYTPLHHLLFAPVPGVDAPVPQALVMTSGNLSDEPICFDDDDARARLGGIVDGWLAHDRPIHVPCDDSVARVVDGVAVPLRRSRGYAPVPLRLPCATDPLLAVGGELKNAFCLASDRDAWMSQHIGDMGGLETLRAFDRSVAQFRSIYGIEPRTVVADLHPAYRTRAWAEQTGLEILDVQHHHAHVAALMAEHGTPLAEAVIGFAFDGTGYGTDGAVWGGEVLLARYAGVERLAHLRYVSLPGGDHAVRKPYRMALAHLRAAGITWAGDLAPVRMARPEELAVLERQLQRKVQCAPTSSFGRLFDAVSSLLGIRHVASYEGQAAVELELAARASEGGRATLRFELEGDEIDPAPVLHGIVAGLRRGVAPGRLGVAFHRAVASLVADTADRARARTGVTTVGLTGGVFQNVVLTRATRAALVDRGFTVLTHRVVPPNDGGLALGQAAVAAARRPVGVG